MKSLIESIYLNSPILFQNILVSIKGCMLARLRNGGLYQQALQAITERNCWSGDQHREYQEQQLIALVAHVYENVPFYSQLYRRHGITPSEIKSVNDLHKLPLITKADIRQNPESFLDKRFGNKGLLELHTTGTTGAPLKILTDRGGRQMNYAFYDGYLRTIGLDISGKKITIGGRVIVPPSQNKPPFWRYAAFQKTIFLSSYHLNERNLPSYVNLLNKFKPEFIDCYPSSIYFIADFISKNNLKVYSPTAIVTSAETLYPEQRGVIEAAFGCNVYDQYGAVEMCGFIGQCKNGHYHIRSDYGVVEILKDGKPAKVDECGEVVLTGFINKRMPLVRYQIGDIAIPERKKCDCGLNTPLVKRIQGRADDVVITKSGTHIGRLSPILKGFPVKEALYIQEKIGYLIVQLVKANNYTEETTPLVIAEIQKRVGSDMEIMIEFVENIEKGKGAKAKAVLSIRD